MKIGILTQRLGHNYGGVLQNYALQTVLRRLGHEPITVAPVKAPLYKRAFPILKHLFLHHVLQNERKTEAKKEQHYNQYTGAAYKHIRRFVVESLTMTDRSLMRWGVSNVRKLELSAYIVDSDQVWRPRYSPYLPAYFFEFLQRNRKVKKLAYAASFGVDEWEFSKYETRMAQKLITQFDAVSVREDSAVKLCKEYLQADAVHVLDPTMLLIREDYEVLIGQHPTGLSSSDGLVTFILDHSEHKQAIVNKVGSDLGLKPYELIPSRKTNEAYPSVSQWLRAFRDARLIVTDSFHGTVFSILFNKPFIAIANEGRGKARFTSILKIFGLENRLVYRVDNIDSSLYSPLNEAQIEATLAQWREKSIEFLNSALTNL